MNNTESLILILVIFVFVVFITYFGSEFIVKYVDLPFLLVFALGIFFQPVWLILLLYAIFKKFEDGPIQRPHQPSIMNYPSRRQYYR